MNMESEALYPKDGQLYEKLVHNSSKYCTPRSPVASHSLSSKVYLTVSRTRNRRNPFALKSRLSCFGFVFLLFITSIIFIPFMFNSGGKVPYFSVVYNSSKYDSNAENEVNRTLQRKEPLSQNGSLRFSGKEQRLPECIIIGARKGGTRALLEFMNLHPMIQIATEETHFFENDIKCTLGLDWYRHQMPYSFPGQITVEKTPDYFITPSVPARIHKMDPSVKLLLIVREPVTRLISDYAQLASKNAAKHRRVISFEDMVLRADGTINAQCFAVRISMYSIHFQRWLRIFPRNQIHIVDGDNLIVEPFREIQKVEDFLGLDHRVLKENFYYNDTTGFYCFNNGGADKCLSDTKGREHPDVQSDEIRKMRKFYDPYNKQFFKQAGLTFNWTSE